MRRTSKKPDVPLEFTQSDHLSLLNADVLAIILSYLDLQSMARLEQTCTYMKTFVEQFGWNRILSTELRTLNDDLARARRPMILAKELLRINTAWKTRTFVASQCNLNNAPSHGKGTETGNAADSSNQSVPFCQLHLLPHGLILLMGSEMRYWPNSELDKRLPISMKNSSSFKLENPANLDSRWIAQHQIRNERRARFKSPIGTTAIWDICASAILDVQGSLIALARVNGLIEIIKMDVCKGVQARIHLTWFWTDLMNSGVAIQTLASCPNSGLLAICAKQGDVWLLSIQKRQTTIHQKRHKAGSLEVRAISQWKVSHRIWSACFAKVSSNKGPQRFPSWLAIGTASREGIFIYSLRSESSECVATLHCDGASIYSIKAVEIDCGENFENGHKIEGKLDEILFAGCYDGKLRTFNASKAIEGNALNAMSTMQDKYDPSAIYCLLTGTGQDGMQIAAGTARHGVVKMFDLREAIREKDRENSANDLPIPASERQGWSLFAAHPSRSPTYSLAGNFDRLFGVTDQKIWQIDLRNGADQNDQMIWNDQIVKVKETKDYELDRGKLAYYRHSDMLLEHSYLPNWITE